MSVLRTRRENVDLTDPNAINADIGNINTFTDAVSAENQAEVAKIATSEKLATTLNNENATIIKGATYANNRAVAMQNLSNATKEANDNFIGFGKAELDTTNGRHDYNIIGKDGTKSKKAYNSNNSDSVTSLVESFFGKEFTLTNMDWLNAQRMLQEYAQKGSKIGRASCRERV